MEIHSFSKFNKFIHFIQLTCLHAKITVHLNVGYCHSL